KPSHRRLFHHLAFYGFLLCLASTATATLYNYVFARGAPYPWYDLPALLGIAGWVGLVVRATCLLAERRREGLRARRDGMDIAFTALLFLTGATGLLLLALRATPAMGTLLAIHLGVVFAFFLAMPYGKFVHGFFRFAALACHAAEQV